MTLPAEVRVNRGFKEQGGWVGKSEDGTPYFLRMLGPTAPGPNFDDDGINTALKSQGTVTVEEVEMLNIVHWKLGPIPTAS
jgi:hypothetical protein